MSNLLTLFQSDGNTVPQSVSGLTVWLDADHAASITKDGSDNVSVWANRANPGTYNATQSGAATAQPDYVASGINGLPVIRFDGTNAYFTLGNVLNGVLAGQDRHYTLFAVIKPDATTGYRTILGKNASSPNKQYFYTIQGGVLGVYTAFNSTGSQARQVNGDQTIGTSAATLVTLGYDGTVDTNNGLDRATFYMDGTLNSNSLELVVGSLSDTIYAGSTHLGIGALIDTSGLSPSAPFDGDMGEILLYDRLLGASERMMLESYLNDKWGTG